MAKMIKNKGFFVLALLLVILMAIPNASALFPTAEYNDAKKTYQLYDWIHDWQIKDKIAEVQLISNTDQCFIDCEAVIRIIPDNDGLNRDILWEFYEYASKEKSISYALQILVTEDYIEQIPQYKQVCTTTPNSTKSCYDELTGYANKTKSREVWKDYSTFEKLEPQKEYYIKLMGKKSPTDRIEWIPTIFGYRLNEWAWWDSSWWNRRILNLTEVNGTIRRNEPFILNISSFKSNCARANCSDIRVTDGINEILYDIYNVTSNNISRIASMTNATASSTTQLYIYYNNSLAPETNYGQVFNFADDYEFYGATYPATGSIPIGQTGSNYFKLTADTNRVTGLEINVIDGTAQGMPSKVGNLTQIGTNGFNMNLSKQYTSGVTYTAFNINWGG